MPLKFFERDVGRLIETDIPNTSITSDKNDPETINVNIDGLIFVIKAKPDYPLGCPDVSYIISNGKNIDVNFSDDWHPASGLVTLIYTLMLDYVPIIRQFDYESNSNISIIESMVSQ